MKLEDAIHQNKPFGSPHEKAVVNLLYTNGWLKSEMKSHFKRFEITGKQYNILRILRGAGHPISTSTLRDRLLDKSSDVSRIVERMAIKGLINKNTCKSDKRLVDVVLTEKGSLLLETIDSHSDTIIGIMSGLTKKEAVTLNLLLDKIRTK